MENKNNALFYGIMFLVVGILVGWAMGSNRTISIDQAIHKMPDGSMMINSGMGMESMMEGMMMNLSGKKGDEFDKAFLKEMIMHHQGAVVMAEAVLETSKRPELIKLAGDIISAQTMEIDMMSGWYKEWFK